jgi:hypothetical protein
MQRNIVTLAAQLQVTLRRPQLRQPQLVEDAMGAQALALLATLNAECDSVERLGEATIAAFIRHPGQTPDHECAGRSRHRRPSIAAGQRYVEHCETPRGPAAP